MDFSQTAFFRTKFNLIIVLILFVVLLGKTDPISLNIGYIFLNRMLSEQHDNSLVSLEATRYWLEHGANVHNDEHFFSAKWGQGLLLSSFGLEAEALQAWRVLEKDKVVERLIAHGALAKDQQNYGDALKWFEWVTILSPELGNGWKNLGHTYEKMGENGLAIDVYQKSTQLSPDYYESYYALGYLLLYQNKNYEEAEEIYNRAIQIDPIPIRAYIALSELHLIQGDEAQSLQNLLNAASLSDAMPISSKTEEQWLYSLPYYELATLYLDQGDSERGVQYLCLALKHDMNQYWITPMLGNAIKNLENTGDSCQDIIERYSVQTSI